MTDSDKAIALRPSYWASVSGGKDSLYMLNYILHHLDRYPLDGVVHFELEIDYPFIHNVIDYMETECKRAGIQFVRIKPRKTWEELYDKCGFPTRKVRWCNGHYKLDAKRQLSEWLNEVGFYVVHYIGYCADEEHRFNKRLSSKKLEIYPLAENGINEDVILEWAKTQPIFNNYYKTNKRCGCMYCPMSSYLNFAYLYKYYPENFRYMLEKMRETEELREKELGRPFSVISSNPKYNADYLEHIVKTKWLKKLNEMEMTNNDYVDAHCVGVDVDGNITVHWVALKSIGKTVFSNAVDAAKYAAKMSDYYDKHYSFGGKQIKRTQWEHFLEKD